MDTLIPAEDFWYYLYRPRQGDIVVDIGAGRGEDVLAFSQAVGAGGRVVAIEADAESFARLQQLCATELLANVTPLNIACMDRSCAVRVEAKENWVSTSVRVATEAGTEPLIQGLRFDDIAARLGIASIDFLKMNIEGAEREALPGCAAALARSRYVCIAAHDFRAERGDGEGFRTRDFVTGFLSEAGFEVTIRSNDARSYVRDHVHGRNLRY